MREPITYRIYGDSGVFLSTWSGPLTDADLFRCYEGLSEMPDWRPGLHELADLRTADVAAVSAEGLRGLSRMVEGHFDGLGVEFKTAVIAPDDLPFGLARLYEMVSDQSPETVQVFRSPSPALKWLRVPPDVLR